MVAGSACVEWLDADKAEQKPPHALQKLQGPVELRLQGQSQGWGRFVRPSLLSNDSPDSELSVIGMILVNRDGDGTHAFGVNRMRQWSGERSATDLPYRACSGSR
jgi:hypothetical protein